MLSYTFSNDNNWIKDQKHQNRFGFNGGISFVLFVSSSSAVAPEPTATKTEAVKRGRN